MTMRPWIPAGASKPRNDEGSDMHTRQKEYGIRRVGAGKPKYRPATAADGIDDRGGSRGSGQGSQEEVEQLWRWNDASIQQFRAARPKTSESQKKASESAQPSGSKETDAFHVSTAAHFVASFDRSAPPKKSGFAAVTKPRSKPKARRARLIKPPPWRPPGEWEWGIQPQLTAKHPEGSGGMVKTGSVREEDGSVAGDERGVSTGMQDGGREEVATVVLGKWVEEAPASRVCLQSTAYMRAGSGWVCADVKMRVIR